MTELATPSRATAPPSGWSVVKFGDVVRQVKDRAEPEASGLERYVAGDHMDTDDLRIRRWGTVGDGYLGPAFHRRFRPGQVLYGSRRTYLRKVAVADFDGICANTTFVCEPATDALSKAFLPYVMQAETFHAHSKRESKGSVNPYINWSDLAWYEFALPPLSIQEQAVLVLRAVADSSESLQQCVAEVRRFVRSAREELATNGVPTSLDAVAREIRTGPFGSQLHASDYVEDGGVPVVMPKDMPRALLAVAEDDIARVARAKASELTQHLLEEDDILLPRRGELDRRALVSSAQAGWLCGTGTIRVRLRNRRDAWRVINQLAAPSTVRWIADHATGTTMPNLNRDVVAGIPLAMPTENVSERLLTAISDALATEAALFHRLSEVTALRGALLRRFLEPRDDIH